MMIPAITLQQISAWHRTRAEDIRNGITTGNAPTHERIADSIDAHLAKAASPQAAALAKSVQAEAQSMFDAYWLTNYPAGCIIGNPAWHAPRIFRAAVYAIDSALLAKAKDGTA